MLWLNPISTTPSHYLWFVHKCAGPAGHVTFAVRTGIAVFALICSGRLQKASVNPRWSDVATLWLPVWGASTTEDHLHPLLPPVRVSHDALPDQNGAVSSYYSMPQMLVSHGWDAYVPIASEDTSAATQTGSSLLRPAPAGIVGTAAGRVATVGSAVWTGPDRLRQTGSKPAA